MDAFDNCLGKQVGMSVDQGGCCDGGFNLGVCCRCMSAIAGWLQCDRRLLALELSSLSHRSCPVADAFGAPVLLARDRSAGRARQGRSLPQTIQARDRENDDGGQLSLITARCRWVGTSEPDEAGRAVAVDQRVQREGLARGCLGVGPLKDDGHVGLLDLVFVGDPGHLPFARRRRPRRLQPEVHTVGRGVDFPGGVTWIDRPNSQVPSRCPCLHGWPSVPPRCWLGPLDQAATRS